MNDNIEFQMTYRKIITIGWIITIIVSAIYLVLGIVFVETDYWYSFPLSYFLGAMINFFAFNILKNNVANLSDDPKKSISGSYSNYFVRFMIYGGVLFISFNLYNKAIENNELIKLNPYIVASGFVTIRLAIYIFTYLDRSKKGGSY